MTPKAVEDDLLDKGTLRGSTFRISVIVFAVLSVLGVVGFVIRLTDGIGNTPVWGYHAALFAFILTAAQGAPMVAIARGSPTPTGGGRSRASGNCLDSSVS